MTAQTGGAALILLTLITGACSSRPAAGVAGRTDRNLITIEQMRE
ncbi:MAG: hypothetical protein ACREMA_18550 [Longimicrobiales bacterium]